MTYRSVLLLIVLLLTGTTTTVLLADDKPPLYDRINLSINLSGEIPNDVLVAVLYIQREGVNTAKLADEVNQAVGWAVEKAKAVDGIQVQTLDYHTSPIYRKQKLTGWRVRQSLRLVSKDAARLNRLLGELQSRLSIQSIGYQTSQPAQKEAEEKLILEAVKAFSQRAEAITHTLGRGGYRLVRMDINGSGGPVRPIAMRSADFKMEAVAAPTLEAGTQTLHVRVSGTIELQTQ